MAKNDINYHSLANDGNPFIDKPSNGTPDDFTTDTENEEPNRDGIIIHVVPDTSKARWNHIEDLDSFFTRMYYYHQKHGFNVMMLGHLLDLATFAFVVWLITGVAYCVDYSKLDGNSTRITIVDIIRPYDECVDSIHGITWMIIFLSSLFWVFRLIRFFYHAVQFYDIKKFFNSALKIEDAELDNYTWHEVQKRIREVQAEQQMCIHKEHLTELDIYHRILRFKNYMVAMMNKNLIQSSVRLPLVGETNFFSKSLRFNLEIIFFRGPWSPFENNWHLKEEFRRSSNRVELSQKLSKYILWAGLINLILSPIMFLFAAIFCFFSYGDLIKRDPGVLGIRCWSQYGMLYMRHFNELDHELQARLNRAYRPAVRYMESFSSPMGAVIARKLSFIFGGITMILVLLFMFIDEDIAHVEHIAQTLALCTALAIVSRKLIPDENLIFCPEQLMTAVLAHTHYLPISWKGQAHTSHVREHFGQFFQMRAFHLLSELISPITTPLILLFYVRPRSLDFVDFFRNFTVSVVGVGDVCSFAQMDVRKHGNPDWQPTHSTIGDLTETVNTPLCETNQYTQGEHGKTELSLVHFALTNPDWKMPDDARTFVNGLKKHAQQDFERTRQTGTNTAMAQSLFSVGSLGGEYSSIVESLMHHPYYGGMNIGHSQISPINAFNAGVRNNVSQQPDSTQAYDFQRMLQQHLSEGGSTPFRSTLHNIQENELDETTPPEHPTPAHNILNSTSNMCGSITGYVSRREGPMTGSHDCGLLHSLYGQVGGQEPSNSELTTADMCLSTLYLYELYYRQSKRRGTRVQDSQRHLWQRPHQQTYQPPTSLGDGSAQTTTTTYTNPPSNNLPMASTASLASVGSAVERTPLLNPKKT